MAHQDRPEVLETLDLVAHLDQKDNLVHQDLQANQEDLDLLDQSEVLDLLELPETKAVPDQLVLLEHPDLSFQPL